MDRAYRDASYLQLLRIPLVRGRHSCRTIVPVTAVALVNEMAAAKFWPGRDPIGERFTMNRQSGRSSASSATSATWDLNRRRGRNATSRSRRRTTSAERSPCGRRAIRSRVLPAVKAAIWSINKDQRLTSDTYTLEGYLDRMIAQRRFNMALLALFGGLGLVIAAVGIYGVMAYLVAQRTNEIGVRMALGATRGNVVAMILRRAFALTVAGLTLGTLLAWPLTSYFQLKSFLFQVEPTDAVTYAVALGVLLSAGLLASPIPARRAASIDPLTALRHE